MALPRNPALHLLFTILILFNGGALCSTFTFVNKCQYTVWPGMLANAGSPPLDNTGFELQPGSSRSLQSPAGWSGRFWARTGCSFDADGLGSCLTGDCGSGQVQCNGLGGASPVTLAEFTLGSGGSQDFYDVSLVDGYNLPMLIEGSSPSGACAATGCSADINRQCPLELKIDEGDACRSACEAFGSPEYCCSGAFNTPATCHPSVYSQMFKSACPRSYSYAYDDATSTFTCTAADYTITLCPSSPSQKSANYASPVNAAVVTPVTIDNPSAAELQYSGGGDSDNVFADGSSWLAGLAIGSSARPLPIRWIILIFSSVAALFCC